jgi:hypothetical protein
MKGMNAFWASIGSGDASAMLIMEILPPEAGDAATSLSPLPESVTMMA